MFRSLTLLLGGLLALHSQSTAAASMLPPSMPSPPSCRRRRPLAPTVLPTVLPPCDYLVVGAGAASLSFVDTLLRKKPSLHVVLVDHHHAPGGHWNDAYDHVQLHAPSFMYGVESRRLERTDPASPGSEFGHRADKGELLKYFSEVVDGWQLDGYNVQYYPNSWFALKGFDLAKGGLGKQCGSEDDAAEAEKEKCGIVHEFEQRKGPGEIKKFEIAVREKVVDGTKGEPSMPSTSAPKFSVNISWWAWARKKGVTREQVGRPIQCSKNLSRGLRR